MRRGCPSRRIHKHRRDVHKQPAVAVGERGGVVGDPRQRPSEYPQLNGLHHRRRLVELLEDCRRVARLEGIGEEVGAGRVPTSGPSPS